MRCRMRRRSVSSLVSPGPRVPMPPPRRESSTPRPESARQEVVELGQLDLEAPLAGARAAGEDVEDELGAVEGLAPHRVLEVPLLGGRELVVEEHQVRRRAPRRGGRTSSTLPRPMRVAGSRRCRSWSSGAHDAGPRGLGQQAQLLEGGLRPSARPAPPPLTPTSRARSRDSLTTRQGASLAAAARHPRGHCSKGGARRRGLSRRPPGRSRRREPTRCRCCSS